MFANPRKEIRVTLFVSLIGFLILFILEAWILLEAGNVSSKRAEELAVQDFLERGNRLVSMFATSPLLTDTNLSENLWNKMPDRIDAFADLFPSLRYMEVRQGKTILFSQQVVPSPSNRHLPDTKVTRQAFDRFGKPSDVAVFQIDDVFSDGSNVSVEIGLGRDALDTGPVCAYRNSLRKSMHVGIILFAFCAVLALCISAWRILYERRIIARQRGEEHLLFSGVLANSIVHDFRNPMSSLKLDVQMLSREGRRAGGVRGDKVTKLTDRIEKTLGRMDEIFREFLYLSRPADSTGGEFDLGKCIESVLEMLAPRMEAQQIRSRFDAPLGAMTVVASEPAVRRVCVNVIMNAIQHSPKGGAIEISAVLDGSFWQIDITDNGPGIPQADRERIFDMFYTQRSGGTGLGLFLARSALTNCGGSIVALSRQNEEGALFRIRIPATRSALQNSVSNGNS